MVFHHRLLYTPLRRAGGALAASGLAGTGLWMANAKSSSSLEDNGANQTEHHHIVVVGGGSAGVAVAAQLRNCGEKDITIIEPSNTHFYQPLWTLVGAGMFKNTRSARPMANVIPSKVGWVQDSVVSFDPENNKVVTASGKNVSYDFLVVATGLKLHWEKIKGLKESLGKNGVVSIYDYEAAQDTWETIQNLNRGRIVFTQPPTQIKCGGAPQKIMWLTDDYLRKQGKRGHFDVIFAIPQAKMFGVQKYSDILEKLRLQRDIKAMFGFELVEVDGPKKVATFKNVNDDSQQMQIKFEMLHAVPPMTAPDVVRNSPLANTDGWVDVDKFTLQHNKYKNVFAIGDSSSLPTSKTIAAIASQAPVLVHNLQQAIENKPLTAQYDGYTSCPILTSYSSLLLAEFKYGGEVAETFGSYLDQGEPRWAFLQLKKYVFPAAYWNLFLDGRWFGCRGILPPSFPLAY